MAEPLLSIVIPTRDRPEALGRLLAALAAAGDPAAGAGWEVIVADDASAVPASAAVAASPLRPVPAVERRDAPAGPGAARNAGAARARGRFLAFLDDDVVPAAGWAAATARALAGGDADVVLGEVRLADGGRPLLRGEAAGALAPLGAHLLVRRTLFEELGGFDPSFADPAAGLPFRDDADMVFRALDRGARVRAAPGLAVLHPDPFPDLASCFRHARRYRFDALLRRRHPARYRDGIEVKEIAGLRIRRPLHAAAALHAVLLAGAAALATAGATAGAGAALAGALGAAALVRARYRGPGIRRARDLAELPAFAVLPLVLLAAILRGEAEAASSARAAPAGRTGAGEEAS